MEIVGGGVGWGLFGRGREAEQVAAKHQKKHPCLLWITHLIFSDGSGALTPERHQMSVVIIMVLRSSTEAQQLPHQHQSNKHPHKWWAARCQDLISRTAFGSLRRLCLPKDTGAP